jgi:hypothetical protein
MTEIEPAKHARAKYGSSPFSVPQRLAQASLASGADDESAARAAGVVPVSIRRWRQDTKFRAEVDRLVREKTSRIMKIGLTQLVPAALKTLGEILADPNSTYSERLKCVHLILGKVSANFDSPDAITAEPLKPAAAGASIPQRELVSLAEIYRKQMEIAAEQASWPIVDEEPDFDDDEDGYVERPAPRSQVIRGEVDRSLAELPPAPERPSSPAAEQVPAPVAARVEPELTEDQQWRWLARERSPGRRI